MSDPVLQLRGIHRTYVTDAGPLPVLKGVDIDLYPGEIVGLIGPSGSGKSSLLHAAGLLERPDAGTIVVDGVDCSNLNERARTRVRLSTVGFVYQFHHLLPEFTALENVALPGRILGLSATQARARAGELLGALGLGARGEHQPAQLSGGEQQRVALARALANRPKILLADEPTGNLDPTTSTSVFQSLFDLSRSSGVAALIATHNMDLARYMDRVFALEDGHLVARVMT
jgi:lipoprotein-releasing system ATP-binding protein